MANFSLTNPTIWIHDTDMSGYLKKLAVKAEVAALDSTTFGSTYHTRIGGLKTVSIAGDGYWDSPPDLTNFNALGINNRVVTVSPQGAETNVAYLWRSAEFTYQHFGTIGEIDPFTITGNSSDSQGLIRGQMAKAKGTVSATGQLGSILTLTSVGATQFLYATLHVMAAATTITVIIESAPLVNFAAPTTRATIGPITVAGGTWLTRVAGPITDAFWRMNVSVITGTFTVAGAIGIQ